MLEEICFGFLSSKDLKWIRRNLSDEAVDFVRFIKTWQPQDPASLEKVGNLWRKGKISFVSACCFHATEERDGLVDSLSPVAIDLIVETAKASIDPNQIGEWTFYTFGPGDPEFIEEMGLSDILLPFMHGLSDDEMRDTFLKQFELTSSLTERLDRIGYVTKVVPLSGLAKGLSQDAIESVFVESEKRGRLMAGNFKMGVKPPKIFEYLSPVEQEKRSAKEAFIYLLLTAAHEESVYLGLEVHGGYWNAGNLNRLNGNLFPLCWPQPALNQHWGRWAEKKPSVVENQIKFLNKIRDTFS